jgi:hypothetical protein
MFERLDSLCLRDLIIDVSDSWIIDVSDSWISI